jgi:Na+/melibiose symporter-like transporter
MIRIGSASPLARHVDEEDRFALAEAVPAGAVLSGTFRRFLPGGILAGFVLATAMGEPAGMILVALAEVVMAAGYAVGLGIMRPSLRSDAGVDGRRSVVAGLVAPAVLFSLLTLVGGTSLMGLMLVTILTGFGVAITMFFPWLRSSEVEEPSEEG